MPYAISAYRCMCVKEHTMGHATSSADGHVCASPGKAEIRTRPDGEDLPPSMPSVCTESTTPSPIAF